MTLPERNLVENLEIILLLIVVLIALCLNAIVLCQLILSGNRGPTVRTNFLTGPYNRSSFTLFKLNICITDFGILIWYGIVKAIWLYTFQWNFGNYGCKLYQFLRAFFFYASSNIIVSIGLDRLKVVYNRHIQGATSVKRVRLMLLSSWTFAFLCALPQLYVWRTFEVTNFGDNWQQCVTIFVIHSYHNTSSPELERVAIGYEIFHQLIVFWIPFIIIALSYIFIVFKLLRYTLRPKTPPIRLPRSTDSGEREATSQNETSMATLSKAIKSHRWSAVSNLVSGITRDSPSNGCKTVTADAALLRKGNNLAWRYQLQSRVFKSVLCIVFAHIFLWLPYNIVSPLRFVSDDLYIHIMENGGNFLEDLIIVNSLLNPLLYADTLSRSHSH